MNTIGIEVSPARAFWRQALEGFTTVTPLPAGRRAVERVSFPELQSETLRLPPGTTARLQNFAETSDIDLRTVVLVAWGIVLSRFSNQEDVLFGFALEGAPAAPLRLRLGSERSLQACLSDAASQVNAVAEHGVPSVDNLLDWIGPHAQSSLFETVVNFGSSLQEGHRVPLVIRASMASAEELKIVAEYAADRFIEGAISNVLLSLGSLLQGIGSVNGDQQVSELPAVGAEQWAQLMRWNLTEAGYPGEKCIHEFVEEQARHTPDRPAVTFQNKSLSYEDLNRRSNQLARHLQTLGAGPDKIVAICLERTVEMMVGLLGILKAGAAYLPLDPGYPQERLEFMLEDSEAVLLLTEEHLSGRFQEIRKQCVKIDTDWSKVETHSAQPLGRTADSTNLAYVIYTSGSTGKPKGVMIEHRQVSNFFTAMDQVIGPETGVWLAVTSISFDISVLELFWTLSRGFHIVLQAESEKLAQEGEFTIPAQIVRHRITHLQCTPSMARILVSSAESRGSLARIRTLLVGGEAFPSALAAELSLAGVGEIHNMYGPTETTVWSTTYRVRGNEESIPIGRPIANTCLHILDKHLKPVPIGAPGELCIGGAGVVRGYLNRPELTRERFPANPFRARDRMYRTGDLARYRPDGEIEFLGRMDNQIKILGFRVELEEIEAVLGRHPGVRAVAVTTREDVPGELRLAAYLVPAERQLSLAKEMRIYAKQKLPPHMLPSSFVFLDSLPSTPNGKVDRKALSALGPVSEGPNRAALDQATMEELVSGVWKDVLGVDELSVTENIFDMGATSLTTIEAAARLREVCQREIAVTVLFQYPNIRALSTYLLDSPGSEAPARLSSGRAQARKAAMLRRLR